MQSTHFPDPYFPRSASQSGEAGLLHPNPNYRHQPTALASSSSNFLPTVHDSSLAQYNGNGHVGGSGVEDLVPELPEVPSRALQMVTAPAPRYSGGINRSPK